MELNVLGMRVRALTVIDPKVRNVQPGEAGIVSAEINAFGDGAGFLVEWDKGGFTNVYPGQVEGE